MCWEGIVLCQGMPKLRHLQTVSHMIKPVEIWVLCSISEKNHTVLQSMPWTC